MAKNNLCLSFYYDGLEIHPAQQSVAKMIFETEKYIFIVIIMRREKKQWLIINHVLSCNEDKLCVWMSAHDG